MSAPTPHVRPTPTGRKLGDGWRTQIVFTSKPNLAIWQEVVTPPGLDSGTPIDTSTHDNIEWQTLRPTRLKRMSSATMVCFCDPAAIPDLIALVNTPTTCTVWFPEGSNWCFFGMVKSAKFGTFKADEKPQVTIEVVVTNEDPVTCAEAGPVFTPGPGTGCY